MLLGKMSDHGRIVFVSSRTHDPKQKTGMPKPKYENAKLLAYPKKVGNATGKYFHHTGRNNIKLRLKAKLTNNFSGAKRATLSSAPKMQ